MKPNRPNRLNRQFAVSVILGGLVVTLVLFQLISTAFWQPLRSRYDQLTATQDKLQDVGMVVYRGERAKEYCDRLAKQSIAEDPSVVAHQYQQWLLKRTENLGEISVIPSPPVAEPSLGYRVPFQLEGDCPLEGLAELVDEINRIPLLHRITYLNIQREARANSTKDSVHFSLTLDALALKNAPLLDAFPRANAPAGELELKEFLVARKLFTQGYMGPPPLVAEKPKPKPKTVPSFVNTQPIVDPLSTLKLVGSVELNGKPQAWLVDSRTRQELFASSSELLTFDTFKGNVSEISNDFIELQTDGRTIRWLMGQSLRAALQKTR